MTLASEDIKAMARQQGLELVGITTADDLAVDEQRFLSRIEDGLLAGLKWLTAERARLACSPRRRFPWARSIISVAVPYRTVGSRFEGHTRPRGRVARYAWGPDYHEEIGKKLAAFSSRLRAVAGDCVIRSYVDTGPIAERAFAARSGVGWFGKNGNILTRTHGSWILIGELLTDMQLQPDEPSGKSCGKCTSCLRACPTGALTEPYVLDNSRCISYLTIELRESVPRELRAKMADRVFGCDKCQEVCPVNRGASAAAMPVVEFADLDLIDLLTMSDRAYRTRFSHSALSRAKLAGLQRNAAIVLGNLSTEDGVGVLAERLVDGSPTLRAHVAWALGRIASGKARTALRRQWTVEQDATVREEIDFALNGH